MKVKRAKISNWKSFPYSETPDWMEFKKLNIFIGPNSHGKTNYVNALRYVLFGNIDTNNVPRDHGLPECNMPDEPIRIDVDVSTSDNPNIELRVQHSFEEFNEVLIKK
ncbi:MAG: AAA family ATPase, partial [Flavobacteriales bacterium]|nr:AAA family ATPase [Flavobacteriales bacterium]